MYSRRTVVGLCGAALAGSLAGCTGSDAGPTPSPEPPATIRVDMTDGLRFEPADITISVGDTVVWETTGTVAHSVTAYEESLPEGARYFASGDFETEADARQSYPDGSVGNGETYEHTFETAGTYPYFCVPHESGMVGTVVVE
jgi:plastocyanin